MASDFDPITVRIRSLLSGRENRMVLNVDPEKLARWLDSDPMGREYVQKVFPELDADEREFLLTGVTPEEWAAVVDHEAWDEDIFPQ